MASFFSIFNILWYACYAQRTTIWTTSFRDNTSSNDWQATVQSGGGIIYDVANCPSGDRCYRFLPNQEIYRYDSTIGYYDIEIEYSVKSFNKNPNISGWFEMWYCTECDRDKSTSDNEYILQWSLPYPDDEFTISLPQTASNAPTLGIDFWAHIRNGDFVYLNDVTLTGISFSCVELSGFDDEEYDGQWTYVGIRNEKPYYQNGLYSLYYDDPSDEEAYYISSDLTNNSAYRCPGDNIVFCQNGWYKRETLQWVEFDSARLKLGENCTTSSSPTTTPSKLPSFSPSVVPTKDPSNTTSFCIILSGFDEQYDGQWTYVGINNERSYYQNGNNYLYYSAVYGNYHISEDIYDMVLTPLYVCYGDDILSCKEGWFERTGAKWESVNSAQLELKESCTTSSPPSTSPSFTPSTFPTTNPTIFPSLLPTSIPSKIPTHVPTNNPSNTPMNYPTALSSKQPTKRPTANNGLFPNASSTVDPLQGTSMNGTTETDISVNESTSDDRNESPIVIHAGMSTQGPTGSNTETVVSVSTDASVSNETINLIVVVFIAGLFCGIGPLLCSIAIFLFIRSKRKKKTQHSIFNALNRSDVYSEVEAQSPCLSEVPMVNSNVDGGPMLDDDEDELMYAEYQVRKRVDSDSMYDDPTPLNDTTSNVEGCWNEDRLKQWLNGMNLGHYHQRFMEQGYDKDMTTLSGLNDDNLQSIGIHDQNERDLFLKELKLMNANNNDLETKGNEKETDSGIGDTAHGHVGDI